MRVSFFSVSRSFSRSTRRLSTMLPRFLLNLMTLNLYFSPISLSRLRIGRRSTCEPGRNAFTPISTLRPPFTRPTMVPSTSSSRSHAAEISSQMRILSAFSFEDDHTRIVFARLEQHLDGVAHLHVGLAVHEAELGDRDLALALVA